MGKSFRIQRWWWWKSVYCMYCTYRYRYKMKTEIWRLTKLFSGWNQNANRIFYLVCILYVRHNLVSQYWCLRWCMVSLCHPNIGVTMVSQWGTSKQIMVSIELDVIWLYRVFSNDNKRILIWNKSGMTKTTALLLSILCEHLDGKSDRRWTNKRITV